MNSRAFRPTKFLQIKTLPLFLCRCVAWRVMIQLPPLANLFPAISLEVVSGQNRIL